MVLSTPAIDSKSTLPTSTTTSMQIAVPPEGSAYASTQTTSKSPTKPPPVISPKHHSDLSTTVQALKATTITTTTTKNMQTSSQSHTHNHIKWATTTSISNISTTTTTSPITNKTNSALIRILDSTPYPTTPSPSPSPSTTTTSTPYKDSLTPSKFPIHVPKCQVTAAIFPGRATPEEHCGTANCVDETEEDEEWSLGSRSLLSNTRNSLELERNLKCKGCGERRRKRRESGLRRWWRGVRIWIKERVYDDDDYDDGMR